MTIRAWVKLNCNEWLLGAISDEDLETKAIFIGLLAMAGSNRFGFRGEIKLTTNFGLRDPQIAMTLRTSSRKWKRVKARLVETDRILVQPGNIIRILNWQRYCSEYQRQVRYRLVQSAQASAQKATETEDMGQPGS